jgi:hypothetical protein
MVYIGVVTDRRLKTIVRGHIFMKEGESNDIANR